MIIRPPRFPILIEQLLGNERPFWSHGNNNSQIFRMEEFAGLPNNILLGIAETNTLSHWKATESSKGSLSYKDLVRRGDAIEQLLRQKSFVGDVSKEQKMQLDIEDKAQWVLVNLFQEAALLHLYTVISGCNPGTYHMCSPGLYLIINRDFQTSQRSR